MAALKRAFSVSWKRMTRFSGLLTVSRIQSDVIVQPSYGFDTPAAGKCFPRNNSVRSCFSTKSETPSLQNSSLSAVEFEQVCEETLDSLAEKFDSLADTDMMPPDFDVQLASGILSVNVGGGRGTYVINRQTPNKQIWLSSPTSGPKRYDFIEGQWIYKHDGVSMHKLLTAEITKLCKNTVDFSSCVYGQK